VTGSAKLVILIHGWSVRSTDTYGQLADRLALEAARDRGLRLDVRNIMLSKYVSFSDEVRMEDLARGLEAALRREFGRELDAGKRFVVITHSTGGPVVREWWDRYHPPQSSGACPMSHLIMLAPPNFGSALAQLGKSRLCRIKTWFQGAEPGARVLDWLELGSEEAWKLNRRWAVDYPDVSRGRHPVYVFTLTGQTIDRALYDHVNSYTGELGSDGVVRVAAANLNCVFVRLEQERPTAVSSGRHPKYEAPSLKMTASASSQRTAFRLVENKAHSGKTRGILTSIRREGGPSEVVDAILRCVAVDTPSAYQGICDDFESETRSIERAELIEKESRLLPGRCFIHDPCCMLVAQIEDEQGRPVEHLDFKLTAGKEGDPNLLPAGFFKDKQRNQLHRGTLTFFLNHAVMHGSGEVLSPEGGVLRPALESAEALGIEISPHVQDGWIHLLPARLNATAKTLERFVRPHTTTMIEVVMRRVMREGVYRLTRDRKSKDFTRDPGGEALD